MLKAFFRAGILAAVCLLLVIGSGCKNKVTKDNFDKIKEGMTVEEVEKILGSGTKHGDAAGVANQFGVDVGGGLNMQRPGNTETYTWESDSKKITVYFRDGKVTRVDQHGL
jgi:hypothetical protein